MINEIRKELEKIKEKNPKRYRELINYYKKYKPKHYKEIIKKKRRKTFVSISLALTIIFPILIYQYISFVVNELKLDMMNASERLRYRIENFKSIEKISLKYNVSAKIIFEIKGNFEYTKFYNYTKKLMSLNTLGRSSVSAIFEKNGKSIQCFETSQGINCSLIENNPQNNFGSLFEFKNSFFDIKYLGKKFIYEECEFFSMKREGISFLTQKEKNITIEVCMSKGNYPTYFHIHEENASDIFLNLTEISFHIEEPEIPLSFSLQELKCTPFNISLKILSLNSEQHKFNLTILSYPSKKILNSTSIEFDLEFGKSEVITIPFNGTGNYFIFLCEKEDCLEKICTIS